jgi:hypothetical protein
MRGYGAQHRGVGDRPDGSCSGLVVVARSVLEQGRLRGVRRSGWSWRPQAGSRKPLTAIRTGYSGRRGGAPSPRAQPRWSCCSSARRGAAGTGAAARDQQWRGWCPAVLTLRFDPTESRERGSRVCPAPLRGRGALAVREWAAQCHGADTGHVAQSPTVAGMGSPRELA